MIAEIAPLLSPRAGERVIEAAGRIVSPGFIDTHSHADGGLADAPDLATQVRQGITTAIVGQDGSSQLPIDNFYASLQRIRPAINFGTTVGHGTVRRLVVGGDFKRPSQPAEIETMKALVDRAMRDGALGLSSGLKYRPWRLRLARRGDRARDCDRAVRWLLHQPRPATRSIGCSTRGAR